MSGTKGIIVFLPVMARVGIAERSSILGWRRGLAVLSSLA